jgi:hypothetical protein
VQPAVPVRRPLLPLRERLAGGKGRRGSQPYATHPTYALTPEGGQQIREDIESMVRDAGEQLHKLRR